MKNLCILGMALVCAATVFTGCGKEKQDVDNLQTSTSKTEDGDLLKDLEEANKIDSLVDKYGRVFYESAAVLKDGQKYVMSIYQDENRQVRIDESRTLIIEDEEVYGMDANINAPFRVLFVENAYEEFMAMYKITVMYDYSEREELISQEVKDGKLYVETKMPEVYEGYFASYGYAEGEIDYETFEYVIDADTLEILELNSYFISGDEKYFCGYLKRKEESEEYVPNKTIVDVVFGSDTRTVTLITDAGTADEKKYSQTCGKGCAVQIFTPQQFETKYYLDGENSQQNEIELIEDVTYYFKRIEE